MPGRARDLSPPRSPDSAIPTGCCSSPSPRTRRTAPSTSTPSAPMCAPASTRARPPSSPAAAPGEFHALTPEEFADCVAAAVEETGGPGAGRRGRRATAPRSPSGSRGSPRRRAPTGCSPCRPTSSSPTRRGCCGTTPSWPRPPRSPSSSTSATTPSSPRRPSSPWPGTDGIIGLKDGVGDLDLMQRIISAVRTEVPGEDFLYFNGLPTAELTGLAYRGLGVTPLLLRRLRLRPRDRPRLPPGAGHRRRRHRPPAARTASTARWSNCATRAAATPSRWSRRAYGCAAWTSARCGRRCSEPAAAHVEGAGRADRARPGPGRGRTGDRR